MRVRRSRLSEEQTRRLLEHFVAGTPARTAAELAHVNRNTARLFYHKLRVLIAEHLAGESALDEQIDLAEAGLEEQVAPVDSGAPVKQPVFALIKRGDKVHTVMLPDPASAPPQMEKPKVLPDSIVYSETPPAQDALDVSGLRHQRVQRRARLAGGRANISSIENFWNQAKRHLRRYNGVPRQHFHLFLKECEWRYNYGPPKELLRILKSWIRHD